MRIWKVVHDDPDKCRPLTRMLDNPLRKMQTAHITSQYSGLVGRTRQAWHSHMFKLWVSKLWQKVWQVLNALLVACYSLVKSDQSHLRMSVQMSTNMLEGSWRHLPIPRCFLDSTTPRTQCWPISFQTSSSGSPWNWCVRVTSAKYLTHKIRKDCHTYIG